MRRLTRLAALGAAVFSILSGLALPRGTQASALATPGVSKNEILIGTSLPQSGLAATYSVIAGGEKAYFDYINAHGGIYGRKLKLVALDDQYDPARTLANVKNLVLSRHVFALLGVLGTDNNLAALPFLTQQQVPLIFPLTGSSQVVQPLRKYVFTYETTYTVEGKALTDYAVKTLHAQKIGVFYQNDDFGKEGLAAVTAEAQKDGASIAASASYELTDLDMTAQVQDLQQSGVDTIIIFAVPPSAFLFLSTAAKAGLSAHILSTSVAADPTVLKALGSAGNGVYFAGWLPGPDANVPQAAAYRSIIAKYGNSKTAPPGPLTEGGMAAAQVLVEGLRRAGRNPTRAGLVKALETLHGWNGSLAPNVSYSASKHDGPEGAYIGQAQNAALVQLTPYFYPGT